MHAQQTPVVYGIQLAGTNSSLPGALGPLYRFPVFVPNVTENETWGWPALGVGCTAEQGCYQASSPLTSMVNVKVLLRRLFEGAGWEGRQAGTEMRVRVMGVS